MSEDFNTAIIIEEITVSNRKWVPKKNISF